MPKMMVSNYIIRLKKKEGKVKICCLTASELYHEEFRKKEYSALDKDLFLKKPIDNEDLVGDEKKSRNLKKKTMKLKLRLLIGLSNIHEC
jgi:hypothetical protein